MLKINGLKKNYKDFNLDCTMQVYPGQITGFIGKNGAGKSTTFKAVLGLIHIDGGSVEIFGKPVENITAQEREKIAVAWADSGFSSYLTINGIANVLKNSYKNFDNEAFFEQCKKLQLPLDKKLKDFSTGMRAKLKVLIAVSHKASLVILDEPTVGLDVIAREDILNLLRDYMEKNEDASILISSHISLDIETLCDDIYMIDNGKIIFHEETDVLLSDYAVMKLSEESYRKIDKQYILKRKKSPYGFRCLTNQKKFYMENYPDVVIENGNIDDLIVMMNGGETV